MNIVSEIVGRSLPICDETVLPVSLDVNDVVIFDLELMVADITDEIHYTIGEDLYERS